MVAAFVTIAVTAAVVLLRNGSSGTTASKDHRQVDTFIVSPPVKDTLPYLVRPVEQFSLLDSTRVIMLKGSILTPATSFPKPRPVQADGDLFFDIPAGQRPFTVRTGLLVLTATGHCTFRVIAYSKESGEEVQVLQGTVCAQKAYRSDYPEPDTLRDKQMLMINKSIDLMEKENDDLKELREWWERSSQH